MGDVVELNRRILEEERTRLEAQLEELGVTAPEAFDPNFADHGQVTAELGETMALADVVRTQLARVEKALARMDEGTYENCEVCGRPIGEARLEAMPSTTVCIDHA